MRQTAQAPVTDIALAAPWTREAAFGALSPTRPGRAPDVSQTCPGHYPGQAQILEESMKIVFWALSRTSWGLSRTLSQTAPMVFQTVPGHFGTMCRTKFSAQCSVHLELYIAGLKFDSRRGQGKLRAEVLPTIQPTFQHSFQLTFQPTSQGEVLWERR